ncbi:TetR/AcrR family transcriptional regulator [Conexibacter sp. SYSU D00693]|uniref:TetR/AcrR family transcriptional regulator n=1 Tax=Conexibacter sp. SYSU D00693 TaxID=2812560 RepID=UPI00196B1169|nr:TetR/AcrR family transcriptional regulator [Conexibacter sp. SYSU D00693]
MSETEVPTAKPKRADAQRNRARLVGAARELFAEGGKDVSLEAIARRADVGIGTLYRNFPTRRHLLEEAYREEVAAMAARAADFSDQEPWEGLRGWLHELSGYMTTKKAIGAELMADGGMDNDVFSSCRGMLDVAGQGLIDRAIDAGIVRPGTTWVDVGKMVSGISGIPNADPGQVERILDTALDGLRYQPRD